MKIAVVGAGIAGVCTAHALAQEGHEVLVFERGSAAAEQASFATAGLSSPGLSNLLSHPHWPDPRWTRQLTRMEHCRASLLFSLRHWAWMQAWKNPGPGGGFLEKLQALHQLVRASQEELNAHCADPAMEHEQSTGSLLLLRSAAEHAALQTKLAFLNGLGVIVRELSPQDARAIEPALNPDLPMHCALNFPADRVHNARQYTLLLKSRAIKAGVQFLFNREVCAIAGGPAPRLQITGKAEEVFDRVVLCTGDLPRFALHADPHALPLVRVLGTSLSAAVREPAFAPVSAVTDLGASVTVVRIGNRIRAAGGYALGLYPKVSEQQSVHGLFQALQRYFPGAAQLPGGTQLWQGSFAMLPDGLPAVGASHIPGVWFNLAHGANGWALAGGSARLVADLVGGRPTGVDALHFSPLRFSH